MQEDFSSPMVVAGAAPERQRRLDGITVFVDVARLGGSRVPPNT